MRRWTILKREEFEFWANHSHLIVRQSEFDSGIYIAIHNRNDNEEYFSSQQLSMRLNDSKVIILNKNRTKIIHRNFKMMTEVI